MSRGVKVFIYPVKDIARARTLFRTLLAVEPYTDQPYYVGFRVGDQEIGLDPDGHKSGATGYYLNPFISLPLSFRVCYTLRQPRRVAGALMDPEDCDFLAREGQWT